MGRRKIEIQPITHERNRSVTFLKRKNGLFKKAYELGVLCSVDVAVIIFEERPGHHVKLYQYCSTDIHDVVQRHLRYDGEKDTRTPVDFSNNPNSKLDDVGEGDEDDVEDDDGPDLISARSGIAKKGISNNGKIKTEFGPGNGKMMGSGNDLSLDVNMDYHLQRPMAIPPPPMPIHHPSQLSPTTGGSSLPISGERERHNTSALARGGQPLPGSMPNKRQRLAPSPSMGGKDDHSYGYHPSSNPGFRHPQQQQQQSAQQFNPFLPASSPPQQPSFLSGLSFDFQPGPVSQAARPPARVGYSSRPSQYSPEQHQQGMYPQLIRQPPAQHQVHASQAPASAGPSPDLFAAFLDADEQRQAQGHPQQFSSLDWPVHAASQQPSQEPAQSQPSAGQNQDSTWLDFLSGGAAPPVGPASAASSRTDGVSWERDRSDGETYRGDGSGSQRSRKSPTSSNASSAVSPTMNNKRPRTDSAVKAEDGQGGLEIDAGGTPPGKSIVLNGIARRGSKDGEGDSNAGGEE